MCPIKILRTGNENRRRRCSLLDWLPNGMHISVSSTDRNYRALGVRRRDGSVKLSISSTCHETVSHIRSRLVWRRRKNDF